ncbi:hypothetical protein PTKIN_Ptkin01aG0347600 [Pterospermum kingtungense]
MTKEPHQASEPEAISPRSEEDNFILKPRELNIIWGDNSCYWRIPSRSQNNNNVEEVAELVMVSWLEVTGSVLLKPSICYQITFKLSFNGGAFGWSGSPVFLMARIGAKGRYKWRRLKELENGQLPATPIEVPSIDDPFVVGPLPHNLPDKRLYIGLYEVWSGKWKGGLKLHEAIIKKILN